MQFFSNLAKLLRVQRNRSVAETELRRIQAYNSVFLGNSTEEDRQIVLVDLADYSGFYRVTPPGAGDVVFNEGMRAVYGRIFRHLRMSSEEIASLEIAARETAAIRQAQSSMGLADDPTGE